jgi:hypothetical protein
VLKEGRTMTVACISKAKEISGVADYVLGYPAQQDASNLESTFIVVEANKAALSLKGWPKWPPILVCQDY